MHENTLHSTTDCAVSAVQMQLKLPQRILVVDRDPYICHLSADVLIQHGFEVNAAEDGADGWEELQANDYNLLITEHDLPRLTGVQLIRKVRAARLNLPVVMVAGKLPTRELARNPSLRFAATLLKPLPVDALLDMVKIVLRGKISLGKPTAPPPSVRAEALTERLQLQPVAPQHRTIKQLLQELRQLHGEHTYSGLND